MLTRHPVLKHGAFYWDDRLMAGRTFRDRYVRIQAAIADAGDDAWLIHGDATLYGQLAYVSNYFPRTRTGVVIVPWSGKPVLLADVGKRDVPIAQQQTWITDVRPLGNPVLSITATLNELCPQSGNIGVVGVDDTLSVERWAALQKALPNARWQSRDNVLMAMRSQKQMDEVTAIRRAAAIVGTGLATAGAEARPSLTVRQLAAHVERVTRARAAEDVRILMASGPQTGISLRPPDDRELAARDAVMIYVAVQYQRYWAEAATTLTLGSAPRPLRTLAEQAATAVKAMAEAARPGVMALSVAAAAGAVTTPAAMAAATAYGLGGGIGLDAEEGLRIASNSANIIPTNTTLALRMIMHGDGYGVAFGGTYLTDDTGCLAFSDLPALVECNGGVTN